MKKNFYLLTIVSFFSCFSLFGQFRSNSIGGYILAIQVDSSNNFILGGQPNKTEKIKYATEDRSQGYSSYTGDVSLWTNAYIYNDSTKRIVKIFDIPLIGVYPALNTMSMMKYDYFYQKTILSGVSKDNLIFAVKTDTYNKDGIIDSDDPVYLFISKKDGTDCKQITPNGMNVTNWRLTNEGNGIIVTIQPDINGDKKFTEDEELYQVQLDSNISKIKILPILNK